jgi:predicted transcriptional regulator
MTSSPNIQIIRSPHKINYSVINNIVIDDPRLDPTALAILIKRIRKPDSRFAAAVVAKEMKKNIGTIHKYLRQLIELGYLDRRVLKNARGQYARHDYLLTKKVTDIYIDINQFDVTAKVEEAL